ncbi:FAD/FMN-containing isoamyl alcohol oxidase-like protein MreA [Westerdykella ornata]|uniref:FAD/FMN-containing isoamyl alcohol oxidase-like protein MreA n=1 Tax=Westerdykella ornata TaxID=318751 RepID=A0A6A6J8F7_WESOR|nr:FAD/FMN-containing isoamyl alcohol oxidase-like protein MreA [Westerdykella ornata]KAF2272840.1 FAD/FMN-containing isoamyl alcohol oxidase-like protein MreA [Westerdykella ornata]
MVLSKSCLLATALTSLVSIAYGQSSSVSSLEPAATIVPEDSAAGAPLLEGERIQLTEAVVERLEKDKTTAEIADLFAFGTEGTVQKRGSARCKTYPGDARWPADWIWDVFNLLLGGSLIPTVPISAPCYDSQWGRKDPAKCNDIVSRFTKAATHEDHPTSIMWPLFQGRTCMARNDTTPADKCSIGGYPAYAVNVTNVAQIQLAVNFARATNIRLVVKNTGHDYLGKSTGAGSLSIWTHNLKKIEYLPNYKSKSYTGKAFKVGAGVTVQEIYVAAEAQNTTVQGGICESVGFAGGYLQGGGHNPLSGLYGMAADSVLAFQVVLASGQFVTASETSYPDLFWALRGGGPGTYGIVTSVIVKAHPNTDATLSTFVLGNSTDGKQIVSRENFFKGVRKYWELFPTYTDAGTYSFFFIFNRDGQLTLDMKAFFAPGYTKEAFQNLTSSWMQTIQELGIPFQVPQKTNYYPSFFPAYWDAWGKSAFPLGTATSLPGNRLIPKSHWTDPKKLETTWQTLRTHVESGRHFGVYHQSPGNKQNVDNSVSSAWRAAQAFFITASPTFLPNATAAEVRAANDNLHKVILDPWRKITPASEGGGSYLNEAAVDEPNWKEDFYGEQYPRLAQIKKKYDPTGLFYVTTGVGSDAWVVEDGEQGVTTQFGKLCRV